MSDRTSIEWADATWNAETFAERFRGVPGHPFEQGSDVRLVAEKKSGKSK